MSGKTFRAALEWSRDFEGDETISLGGGEPTIHPKFWEFIGLALGNFEFVWLATNGKETETALSLAKMARRGVIGCALSQDEYHEGIDPRVVEAFTTGKKPPVWGETQHDYREIRTVSEHIVKAGRAAVNGLWTCNDRCPCPDPLIDPAGKIHACGCKDAPVFGSVFEPEKVQVPEGWVPDCWKSEENQAALKVRVA